MFSKEDQQVIKAIIEPIKEQASTQAESMRKIAEDVGEIKTVIAVNSNRLGNIEKHLERQNGRLDIVEDKCTKHSNNWGWTRKIVLWVIGGSGLVGLIFGLIRLLT